MRYTKIIHIPKILKIIHYKTFLFVTSKISHDYETFLKN